MQMLNLYPLIFFIRLIFCLITTKIKLHSLPVAPRTVYPAKNLPTFNISFMILKPDS